jgi:hypothetical protein
MQDWPNGGEAARVPAAVDGEPHFRAARPTARLPH